MRWVVGLLTAWIAAMIVVQTFFMEWRYDCSHGNSSCTREKLLMWRK